MNEALKTIADLMALSARTAPKGAGKDFVVAEVITGDAIQRLADEMNKFGAETGKVNFDRDARGVAASGAVVLIGIKDAKHLGLNCGACGQSKCSDLPAAADGPEFKGPSCPWRVMDLGIAIGSAVKTASIHNADNRIMYRAGVLAKRIGLIDADLVVGIPLTATGKSPFFDR